jgi:hypothetical protein
MLEGMVRIEVLDAPGMTLGRWGGLWVAESEAMQRESAQCR